MTTYIHDLQDIGITAAEWAPEETTAKERIAERRYKNKIMRTAHVYAVADHSGVQLNFMPVDHDGPPWEERLTNEAAEKLIADLQSALAANREASRPKITVTPGRYRMGDDGTAVVLAIVGNQAVGYSGDEKYFWQSLNWHLDGGYGRGRGDHSTMDLMERLPDTASATDPEDQSN